MPFVSESATQNCADRITEAAGPRVVELTEPLQVSVDTGASDADTTPAGEPAASTSNANDLSSYK